MNEFRRFIQEQLDMRGWKQAELATRSGLTKQHVSKLLRNERDHLGQMPSQKTIEGLAKAFQGVSTETIRDIAARALGTVEEDERQSGLDLRQVSLDALLNEIRRRVPNEDTSTQDATRNSTLDGEAGTRGTPMNPKHPDNVRQLTRPNQPEEVDEEFDDTAPPPEALDFVARETPPGYKKGYDIDREDDDS